MNPKCIQSVVQAIGRDLTKVEIDGIESRIAKHMRGIAKEDPKAWTQMTQAERLQGAAERSAMELVGEAQLKEKRATLTVIAHDRIQQHIEAQAIRGIDALDALDRTIAFHADMKSNFISIESQSRAVRDDALRQMLGTLTATNPKWFGLFENRAGVEALVKEIFGEQSGVPEAKAGAKEWAQTTSGMRDRFNRNGGDIGELDDWGLPHHHSQVKVAKVGREKWVADITPLIDRGSYFNPDGTPMGDVEINRFLGEAWTTIATGGANKVDPGVSRGSSRANRGNASRQIHYKDAASYLEYQAQYGERSLYEVLTNHIENIAKDIALVETYGPNPDNTFKYFRDKSVQEGKIADPTKVGKFDERAIKSENLYNAVSGKTIPVASQWLADSFDTLRSWLVASRLGSAVITSLSDDATLYLTGKLNNLPEMRLIANELAALNPANRVEERMAQRAGLGLRTLVSSLNRFGQDGLGAKFSRQLASTVMRASGLNAMTEARRRAFGVTMMGSIGAIAKDHANLSKLDPMDNRVLLSKGVTETDFQVWKKAKLEDWGGGNDAMLTPESIYRIPDADLDAVIAPEHARIRAEAQAHIDELNSRNMQDQQWLDNRKQKISAWLAKSQADIAKRLANKTQKLDDKTNANLSAIADRLSKLQERVDLAEGSWMTPEDANTPGVDSQKRIADYGKRSLRKMGKDEGAAREAIKNLESEASSILSDAKRIKAETQKGMLDTLFKDFDERRNDLTEFAKRATDRQQRRDLVKQRIADNVDVSLDAARMRAREQAATKLLAHTLEETDVAIIEPGVKERTITGANIQRGTWKGELVRSFFLFKSFPLAMIARHWERGMSLPTLGGKAKYIGTLVAATTVAGVVSLQISELLSGRDPRNMNPFEKGGVRNWIAAMLKGGSMGIYGDFLFSESTQHGQSPVASVMGPAIGTAESAFNLTQGNLLQAAQGKDTHFGAELVKFGKGMTPGASLWYAKGALDHVVYHQMQEYFSPGYLSNMRARAQRDFGQRYWWEPGEVTPYRLPDAAAIVGE